MYTTASISKVTEKILVACVWKKISNWKSFCYCIASKMKNNALSEI